MVIKGNNVYLRTIRETDLDWLYDHMTDVELRGQYFPISIPSETEFKGNFHKHGYWSDDYGMLLIADAKDNRVLGTIMRFRATPYWDNYEVGYRLLDLNLGGRGIMSEALMLFTYVLFAASPPVHRLELKIIPENIGSRRVAEKCGYQLEGTAREVLFHLGRFRDMVIYSMLRQEAPGSLEEALARLE